jgi:hypothetical protein
VRPVEFDIPRDATRTGELRLMWYPATCRSACNNRTVIKSTEVLIDKP